MTINSLDWQLLLPNLTAHADLFTSAELIEPVSLVDIQPRLNHAINLFCQPLTHSRFMLIKSEEHRDYLANIAQIVQSYLPTNPTLRGSKYQIEETVVSRSPATSPRDNFAATSSCAYEEWLESEQIFGCLRHNSAGYELSPGLIHQINGGVLIIPARTLLTQPQLWLRLKQTVFSHSFHWFSSDELRPLPLTIPDMPMDLRIILVGDRQILAELQEIEPELVAYAPYAEFESDLRFQENEDAKRWCGYVKQIARSHELPPLDNSIWPSLFRLAIRHSGDQNLLPLDPLWIANTLKNTAIYAENTLTAENLEHASALTRWHSNYLIERSYDEIELDQIHIDTEGSVVGQINGLSVLEYPGHPLAFGEPSRITCVAHLGDGEITDVERKSELGGNLHAKGMMIMEAFLISELALDQPFPFAASLVFEQSYGEVDGDSASLAELCALISALSLQPIAQNIAVTGSIDQFGNVQPIGGINEKIEGFFAICQRRGLSGNQGVILPASNLRHLCLNNDVVQAVQEGTFHLWSIESIEEAALLLMGVPYQDDNAMSLLGIIQERILQASSAQKSRRPWFLRWLNCFN